MKLALQLALGLTLLAASCRCPYPREQAIAGRWQVTQTPGGNWLLTDTATGHAWYGRRQEDESVRWNSLGMPEEAE